MPMFLFLRRLRHSPAAFCGLIIILLLMLIALFAPWLAPHDPNWQDARPGYKHRVVSTGSALTVTGETYFHV
ncbi:hypothetical protein ECAZ01_02907 [Escherichia coli]|nr:hypothetical protein ECAZ01_02907 [Escherichia coli]